MKLDDATELVRKTCANRFPGTADRDSVVWRDMVLDWLLKGVEVAAIFRSDGRFLGVHRSAHAAKAEARSIVNNHGTTDLRIKRITF